MTRVKQLQRWPVLVLAVLLAGAAWGKPGQKPSGAPVQRFNQEVIENAPNAFKHQPQLWLMMNQGGGRNMQFYLEWTNYRIHRINDATQIQVELSGMVQAGRNLHWQLYSISPEPFAPLHLYHVQGAVQENPNPYTQDIPLTLEFSLDGAPFEPLEANYNHTFTVRFPPGPHTFVLRFTGTPPQTLSDGYYMLQLGQQIVPTL